MTENINACEGCEALTSTVKNNHIRKLLLRFLPMLFVLMLVIFSASCTFPELPGNTTGGTESIDRTDPSAGTYEIRFYLGPRYVTHYYNEGETITPPDTLPSYYTRRSTLIFDGWSGVTFATVTGNATYRAKYREEFNYYTVTFVVGDVKKEVKTICDEFPVPPAISEFNLSAGEKFVTWDKELASFNEDVTLNAITVKYFEPDYFLAALRQSLLAYPTTTDKKDNSGGTANKALALTVLLIEENQNPKGGVVANRIVEHLISVVSPQQAPAFDACCFWSYAPHSGAIAIAKATPTVWELLPDDIKLRLDTMMRAFAYLESFATSDYNSYKTGPGMQGNYNKTWNPNYRLANIPVMVYVTYYFGDGDMDKGAENVNHMLKSFNEEVYDEMIDLFQKYGWHRALAIWTAEARTSTDGKNVKGESAKQLLIYGGQAVGEDTSTSSDLKVALGTGVGVGNGGKDYLYNGYALNEPEGIIRSLLMHNYGTGDLTKKSPRKSTFLQVKSEHWYGGSRVAWIMGDLKSPYEGQYGMMKEFASGDRSSASYCSHDFVLTTSMIYTCKILGIYDLATDSYTDKNGVCIREAIIVGNEDFLYKNEKGYQGYASGSYGISTSSHSEKGEDKSSYFALKSLWRNFMKPELEATLPE